MKGKIGTGLAIFLIAALIGGVGFWWRDLFTLYWTWKESNPIYRGRQIAIRLGCISCHGPGNMKGIRNPKTDGGTVPEWGGGTHMMYLKGKEEIREYILDGFPERKKENPQLFAKFNQAGFQMPAYRDLIQDDELTDLLAYVEAVTAMESIPDRDAQAGRNLALKWNCFQCHGMDGSGGPPNPGSFSGFVPGWLGPAYEDLVRSEDELREWIRTGTVNRLEKNFASQFFLSRQKIKMAGYETDMTEKKIDQIVAYINWLRKTYSDKN